MKPQERLAKLQEESVYAKHERVYWIEWQRDKWVMLGGEWINTYQHVYSNKRYTMAIVLVGTIYSTVVRHIRVTELYHSYEQISKRVIEMNALDVKYSEYCAGVR